MQLHEKFEHSELRDTIFGWAPEYSNPFDLAIFLRRVIILSATLARVYYKQKHTKKDCMTARTIERIVSRPYISIDNSISILTALQNAGDELDKLGLSALKPVSDENNPNYINLYEVKSVLQDEAGKFFDVSTRLATLNKVVGCIPFITKADIKGDENGCQLVFDGETFDIGDLFQCKFTYMYCALQDVDPLTTIFVPL